MIDVVAGADVERAEVVSTRGRAGLDVEALVADRVAVQRRGPVGDDVRDPHVVVGEQVLPAEDRVGAAGVELVGAQVARLERLVRRPRDQAGGSNASAATIAVGRCRW